MKTLILLTTALLITTGCATTGVGVSSATDHLFDQKEWQPVNNDKTIQKEIFYEK